MLLSMSPSSAASLNAASRLLIEKFGSKTVLNVPTDLARYERDSSKQFSGTPSCVVCPSTISELSELLAVCSAHRLAVVPSGGRTGYSGGATATQGEVLLSLERLNKIISLSVSEASAHVQAGVTLEKLQDAANAQGLLYPVDFTSRGSAHIGGTIATNAGGMRVIRYGSTREWVRGLTVVLASGKILTFPGRLVKDNTGYDLCGLFVGSEGTLGVIVEAVLGLAPAPGPSELFIVGVRSFQQIPAILKSITDCFTVSLVEYFERPGLELVQKHRGLRDPFDESFPLYLLVEVECPAGIREKSLEPLLERLIGEGAIAEAVISESSEQRKSFMGLRELIGDVANSFYTPHKNDISVPVADLGAFIERLNQMVAQEFPTDRIITFGHVGDGNVHVNLLKPDQEESKEFFGRCAVFDEKLFALVQSFSGSISAEHGVGLLKKAYLGMSRSRTEIELMRGLKKTFDPNGILNPGKIFDPI